MVQVVVPSMLAAQAEGTRRFEVEAETVGDALHALPVADLLFNERGELNRHLNVYVDGTRPPRAGRSRTPAGGCARDPGRRDGLRRVAHEPVGTMPSVLVGRSDECARARSPARRRQGGAERGPGAARRGRDREDRAPGLRRRARRRLPHRPRGRGGVGDGAAVRRPASAVRRAAGPPRAAAGAPARRARDRVRPELGRPARPLPDQPRGAQPAVRGGRGAAAPVPGRRRAVARSLVRAGARVRGAAPAGRVGRAPVRGA